MSLIGLHKSTLPEARILPWALSDLAWPYVARWVSNYCKARQQRLLIRADDYPSLRNHARGLLVTRNEFITACTEMEKSNVHGFPRSFENHAVDGGWLTLTATTQGEGNAYAIPGCFTLILYTSPIYRKSKSFLSSVDPFQDSGSAPTLPLFSSGSSLTSQPALSSLLRLTL